MIRRMELGREKHSPPERNWEDKTKMQRNLRIVFKKETQPGTLSPNINRNMVESQGSMPGEYRGCQCTDAKQPPPVREVPYNLTRDTTTMSPLGVAMAMHIPLC